MLGDQSQSCIQGCQIREMLNMLLRLSVDHYRVVEDAAMHDAMAYEENVGRVDVTVSLGDIPKRPLTPLRCENALRRRSTFSAHIRHERTLTGTTKISPFAQSPSRSWLENCASSDCAIGCCILSRSVSMIRSEVLEGRVSNSSMLNISAPPSCPSDTCIQQPFRNQGERREVF
jgi:hypothetical protein